MSDRNPRGAARQDQQNDPPLLIMTSLAEGPKHGYALLGDIEDFAGVRLGPGTLYGAIGRLEERGLIEPAAPEGRARPYRLTAAGRSALQARLAELSAIVGEGHARLEGATAPRRGPAPEGAAPIDGTRASRPARRLRPGGAIGGTA
ncbi:MAG: PadR family transcriptional regulator [Solirubrobacteraceae bacterium]